jgi:hypothetical protein
VPYVEWFVHEGHVPLDQAPPVGVFYNRMSASSHTRGHRHSVELTAQLLAWLQRHGRRVVNGRRALQLEVSKFEQYLALDAPRHPHAAYPRGQRPGGPARRRPRARAPSRSSSSPTAAARASACNGFNSVAELERQVAAGWEAGLDGIDLVQEYIPPAGGHITRMEFIAGRYFYQVEVDASGGFELCPADSCAVGEAFCPAPGEQPKNRFRISRRGNRTPSWSHASSGSSARTTPRSPLPSSSRTPAASASSTTST